MNYNEIKTAVLKGINVYWTNFNFQVINYQQDFFIMSANGSLTCLTYVDTNILTANETDFFTIP